MKKLLIAESVKVFAEVLTDQMQRNWEVHVCEDGYAAMDILSRLQPEALIIDLKLPMKDGLSVLAECFPDLPPAIVALSASATPAVAQAAARWGVDYLYEIPFDPEQVRMALDEAVGQQIPAKRTAQHLRVLGFRSGLDGYSCLVAAVCRLLQDPAQKLCMEVYDYVAKVCGLTDHRDVDHAIRTAIKDAWKTRDIEQWAKYFPLNAEGDVDRPKSKDLIRLLMLLVQ